MNQGLSYHLAAYRDVSSATCVLREDKRSLNVSPAVQCSSPTVSSIWSFAFLLGVTYIDSKLLLTFFIFYILS